MNIISLYILNHPAKRECELCGKDTNGHLKFEMYMVKCIPLDIYRKWLLGTRQRASVLRINNFPVFGIVVCKECARSSGFQAYRYSGKVWRALLMGDMNACKSEKVEL